MLMVALVKCRPGVQPDTDKSVKTKKEYDSHGAALYMQYKVGSIHFCFQADLNQLLLYCDTGR